jgi:hypothetical protein
MMADTVHLYTSLGCPSVCQMCHHAGASDSLAFLAGPRGPAGLLPGNAKHHAGAATALQHAQGVCCCVCAGFIKT